MTENIHHHSKGKARKHREQTLKTGRTNSKCCTSVFDAKVLFRSPIPFSFVYCNIVLFLAGFTPSLPLSSAGISWFRPHQHSGVSKAMQASPSQIHRMASFGLHAGIPLTHAWPQRLSLLQICIRLITNNCETQSILFWHLFCQSC